uniref:phospholipase A1 n=1 Tax=Fopius arisanus TaxID=64838 RepID=A0A0C9QB62_9HYME
MKNCLVFLWLILSIALNINVQGLLDISRSIKNIGGQVIDTAVGLSRDIKSRIGHSVSDKEFTCVKNGLVAAVADVIFLDPHDEPTTAKINLDLFVQSDGEILSARFVEEGHYINIEESKFHPERKTVFIVHGYRESGEDDWLRRMATAYVKYEDVNVIVVDWSVFSKNLNYKQDVYDSRHVATQVKDLSLELLSAFPEGTAWGPIHLIGFSLGAHIVGMIGQYFKHNITEWPVERITGLDPAHPCIMEANYALNKEDAPFVDIIHTNGHKGVGISLGMLDPRGHVDFYVNGGQIQPNCGVDLQRVVQSTLPLFCSHHKAHEYFIESLEVAATGNGSFLTGTLWNQSIESALIHVDTPCETTCQNLGITAHPKPEGSFFVPTASDAPYYEIKENDREKIKRILRWLLVTE